MDFVTRAVLPLGLVLAGVAATWQLHEEPPVIAKLRPKLGTTDLNEVYVIKLTAPRC